jgi:hypothetical protein
MGTTDMIAERGQSSNITLIFGGAVLDRVILWDGLDPHKDFQYLATVASPPMFFCEASPMYLTLVFKIITYVFNKRCHEDTYRQ